MTNSVNFPHGIYKQSPVLGYWVNVSINHDCTDVVHCTLRGMFPIKLILNGCNAFSLWVFVWLSVINQNVVLETASVAGTNTEEIFLTNNFFDQHGSTMVQDAVTKLKLCIWGASLQVGIVCETGARGTGVVPRDVQYHWHPFWSDTK